MPSRYLDLLSGHDLLLLADASKVIEPLDAVAAFKARPTLIVEALESPTTYPNLTRTSTSMTTSASTATGIGDIRIEPSALLVFAAIVHHCCGAITTAGFRAERIGTRIFLPYVANHDFVDYASQAANRLFLIELLGSYARSPSGSAEPRCNDLPVGSLDPVVLARSLSTVDQRERVGIYRRLGDLALFRSGVINDDPNRMLPSADADELAMSLPANVRRSLDRDAVARHLGSGTLNDACRELGPIWYRAAANLNPFESLAQPIRSVADDFDAARLVLRRLARTELLNDRQSSIFPNCALIP